MKILIIKKDVTDILTVKAGLLLAQNYCTSIGIPLSFKEMNFTGELRSIPFSNDVNQNGHYIDPTSFLGPWNVGYDAVCLIYDSKKVKPEPTNPTDNGPTIQIPINWFTDTTVTPNQGYPEVFAQYLLHELCHLFFAKTGKKDTTHDYIPEFSQKQRYEYYLYLLQGLVASPTVTIKRFSDDGVQALGDLSYESFSCKTLERPWKGNQKNISCIPPGTYQVKWTFSWKFMKYTYEVQNVPGRSGIRLHKGSTVFDVEGCILVGTHYTDVNHDKWADIANSGATLKRLEDLLERREFTLIIK